MCEKSGIELRKQWWGIEKVQAESDKRLELLKRVQPYMIDYLHIFEGDCIEDLNMLAYLLEDIEEELGE